MTLAVRLGRQKIKLAAKNLLDSEERVEQMGATISSRKPGHSFSLSIATGNP